MDSCFLALQLTCLSEQLQPDVGARMVRCEAQMERFDFFFALHLGELLYSHTDNLSKDLQGTKMAAVSGQHLTNATKEMFTKIHTDQSFDHFLLMLPARVKACLVTQCFQESDALRPDWRLVLVHQATPKLPKIT